MSTKHSKPEDSPRLACILCCEPPRLPQWELPLELPPDATVALLGWLVSPATVDAGLPDGFARLLADVLTQHVRVSFFTGAPQRRGLLARWFSPSAAKPGALVHTRDPRRVHALFASPAFDWSLRATAAFLSPPDAPAPALAGENLENALAGRAYDGWRARGVVGLVMPGVDGQVLGAYAFDTSAWTRWKDSLREAARRHDIDWRDVDEDAFVRALID